MKKTIYSLSVLLTGCFQPVMYPPSLPLDVPPPPKKNGSIYQAGYSLHLYNDKVAARIGDVLTVKLEEVTRGQYRARTNTDKNAKLNYPIPILFGNAVPELEVKTDTQQKFNAIGNSDQSDQLLGTISVTVCKVLSNGNLVVQGESWVGINQGRKYMRLRGIVRQRDIDPDNSISSKKVANAEITYGAAGQAGYANRGGLMTKLFNRFAPY